MQFDPTDGNPWWCNASPDEDKRHAPAPLIPSSENYLSRPRKVVAAHLVTGHGFGPAQADSILGQIEPGPTVAVRNLRIHRAGKSGQYGIQEIP